MNSDTLKIIFASGDLKTLKDKIRKQKVSEPDSSREIIK